MEYKIINNTQGMFKLYEDKTINEVTHINYDLANIDYPKLAEDLSGFTQEDYSLFINRFCFKIYFKDLDTLPQDIINTAGDIVTQHKLRDIREIRCFKYVNRGEDWKEAVDELITDPEHTIPEDWRVEFKEWYRSWLEVTTPNIDGDYIIPDDPTWLKEV